MFSRLSRSSKIERILVVSLSNIGDVVLTLPVVDALRAAFPSAELHLIVGLKARGLFVENPHLTRVIAYDKQAPWPARLAWFLGLRRVRFDLVVDLRNSMLPVLLNAGTVTRPVCSPAKVHMKDKHLARLGLVLDGPGGPSPRSGIVLSASQRASVDRLVRGWRAYALVAPGAADPRKRWDVQGFVDVVGHLRSKGRQVILVGDEKDRPAAARIAAAFSEGVLDLCGGTSLIELAGVVAGSAFAVTNDSGTMHLASYFDKPVIALFGYTDPFFYGPWSARSVVLRKGTDIASISSEDVIAEVDKFLC